MPHPITDDLATVDPAQRAAYKAAAFAALPPPENNLVTGNRIVSITDGPTLDNGAVKFSVALTIDGSPVDVSSVNPIRVVNPPILVPDPGGDIERTYTDPITQLPVSTFYREDLEAVLMQIAYEVTEKFEGGGNEM